MADPMATLAEVNVYDELRVTLLNGTSVEGRASPVDYVPEDHLRIEIKEEDDDTETTRYEISAAYVNGEWEHPRVRRYKYGVEEDKWVSVGKVGEAKIAERDHGSDHA
ncbi:hypothetical protein [Natrinema sp. 74]|uniref:hypothetical protein n=1 Tax=Natrinema sp. 74 TaxID=3384159 RepID=UPI0038D4352F